MQEITLFQIIQKLRRVFSNDEIFVFSAPNPIKKFYYRCDKIFHLDHLINLYKTYDEYAIVLVSGKCSEYYIHSRNNTKLLKNTKQDLPNQHKTGGQSAQRFGRIRDEKIDFYINRIIEIMVHLYVVDGVFYPKGLIIAGPSEIKHKVCSNLNFEKIFGKYLLKVVTIAEISDNTICQVTESITDIVSDSTDIVKDFESKLADESVIDLIVFGEINVMDLFLENRLSQLYVSNDYDRIDDIDKSKKTIVHKFTSGEFVSKYGRLVGILHYKQEFQYDSDEN